VRLRRLQVSISPLYKGSQLSFLQHESDALTTCVIGHTQKQLHRTSPLQYNTEAPTPFPITTYEPCHLSTLIRLLVLLSRTLQFPEPPPSRIVRFKQYLSTVRRKAAVILLAFVYAVCTRLWCGRVCNCRPFREAVTLSGP